MLPGRKSRERKTGPYTQNPLRRTTDTREQRNREYVKTEGEQADSTRTLVVDPNVLFSLPAFLYPFFRVLLPFSVPLSFSILSVYLALY